MEFEDLWVRVGLGYLFDRSGLFRGSLALVARVFVGLSVFDLFSRVFGLERQVEELLDLFVQEVGVVAWVGVHFSHQPLVAVFVSRFVILGLV